MYVVNECANENAKLQNLRTFISGCVMHMGSSTRLGVLGDNMSNATSYADGQRLQKQEAQLKVIQGH